MSEWKAGEVHIIEPGRIAFQWRGVSGTKMHQWLKVSEGYEEQIAESLKSFWDAAQREALDIARGSEP